MKKIYLLLTCMIGTFAKAQVEVDFSQWDKKSEVKAEVQNSELLVTWPAGNNQSGRLIFNLQNGKPLFNSIQLSSFGKMKKIGINLDPVFLLTVGKRDLVSQNGWNIFFDKTNKLPHQTYTVNLNKKSARVSGTGSRTVICFGGLQAGSFKGDIEITVYKGSPLFNVAAVVSTEIDSTAILYDAGLVGDKGCWDKIAWTSTQDQLQSAVPGQTDTALALAVKYRTIVGENEGGKLALFPAPHQFFYPLDEAFNLKFTWFGDNYRDIVPKFGMGIRQDLMGDNRYVPWFNSPPGTRQRLNFFCLLNTGSTETAMEAVKRFTNADSYQSLPGYKTMSSHFHNEYVMKVMLANKAIPGIPNFVNVFRKSGVDMVHLAEFHYTAHPQGPDTQRLKELKTLFDVCQQFSDDKFLLMPGEEPNEFFGGHWLELFPKPVYWIMSRKPSMPFVAMDSSYGKVYRVSDKEEMLKLLETENGLAWTAHARTKGSTGYPDKYMDEGFYKSEHFFGAAWKAMPADLSLPKLGKRVLDLMDDMANKGFRKHVIAEADLFSIEPENEMYAHLNVNYLQLDKIPVYKNGWQPVLDAMQKGKFFVSTGEVLLPVFKVNGKSSGETIQADKDGKAVIELEASWTFPLNFAEIITGDGEKVYREKINLDSTLAFGKNKFIFSADIKNKKWVRFELWDVAADGAFTQQVWID